MHHLEPHLAVSRREYSVPPPPEGLLYHPLHRFPVNAGREIIKGPEKVLSRHQTTLFEGPLAEIRSGEEADARESEDHALPQMLDVRYPFPQRSLSLFRAAEHDVVGGRNLNLSARVLESEDVVEAERFREPGKGLIACGVRTDLDAFEPGSLEKRKGRSFYSPRAKKSRPGNR